MPIFMRVQQLFNRLHPTNRNACKRALHASEKGTSLFEKVQVKNREVFDFVKA